MQLAQVWLPNRRGGSKCQMAPMVEPREFNPHSCCRHSDGLRLEAHGTTCRSSAYSSTERTLATSLIPVHIEHGGDAAPSRTAPNSQGRGKAEDGAQAAQFTAIVKL